MIAAGRTQTVILDKPIAVKLLYWTTEVDAKGRVSFFPDVYGRDPASDRRAREAVHAEPDPLKARSSRFTMITPLSPAPVTLVAIQAAAIVALLVQRSRRRLAERSARASAERLRVIAERAPDCATVLLVGAAFAVFSTGSVQADDSAATQGWDWRITPFLWAAGIDGNVSLGPASRPVDVAFSDIVNVLDGVVLLHFEGTHAGHGIFGDVTWLSLAPDDKVTATGGVTTSKFTTTIVEGGYLRELSKDLSLGFGMRYWDFGLEIVPARVPAAQRDDSWIDYFVGIRHDQQIGKNWRMTAEGNIGTGGSDTPWGVPAPCSRASSTLATPSSSASNYSASTTPITRRRDLRSTSIRDSRA